LDAFVDILAVIDEAGANYVHSLDIAEFPVQEVKVYKHMFQKLLVLDIPESGVIRIGSWNVFVYLFKRLLVLGIASGIHITKLEGLFRRHVLEQMLVTSTSFIQVSIYLAHLTINFPVLCHRLKPPFDPVAFGRTVTSILFFPYLEGRAQHSGQLVPGQNLNKGLAVGTAFLLTVDVPEVKIVENLLFLVVVFALTHQHLLDRLFVTGVLFMRGGGE